METHEWKIEAAAHGLFFVSPLTRWLACELHRLAVTNLLQALTSWTLLVDALFACLPW